MDELQKLYDLLVREGKYTKSFDDFKVKWSSEQGYQDKVFDVVSRDKFYTKDRESFMTKYGTAQSAVQGEQFKKKEEAFAPLPEEGVPSSTELPSGDGKLVSPEPIKPVAAKKTIDETPKEKPFFTGKFGAALEVIDLVSPFGVGDFIDDMGRAIDAGRRQGAVVTPANELMISGKYASPETIQKFVTASKAMQNAGPSDEMMNYQKIYEEEGKGIFGVLKGLAKNPGAIPELIMSSYTAMVNPTSLASAGTVVGGAAAGGALFGGAGAAPAAIASAPFAMAAAGTTLETGLTFSELLQEKLEQKKLEFTEENVKKILEDENALSDIRVKSVARGATIGIIDAMTGRLAGKVGARILGNTPASKVKAGLAGGLIESVGGSTGETAGRIVAGQPLDVSEITLEGISESPSAAIDIVSEIMSKPVYKVNGENRTEADIEEILRVGTPDDISRMNIEIKNDNKGYKEKVQDIVVTNQIRKEVSEVNPDIDEDSLNTIVDLEKKLKKFEGNKTQSGKDKAADIRSQIKTIQENAIQEQTAGEVPVQPRAEVSGKVEGGKPQAEPQGVTKEGEVKEKEIGSIVKWDVFGNEETGDWNVVNKTTTRGGQPAVTLNKVYVEDNVTGKSYTKEYADKNGIKYDNERIVEHIVPLAELQVTPTEGVEEVVQEEVTPELTESEQERERYRLEEEVFRAKRNIAMADDTEVAIEEYNAAKKSLEDFDKAVQERKNKARAKNNIESIIDDEKTASQREGYEYKDLYEQDPRLAALQNSKDLLEFVKSEDIEERSTQREETIEEAKKSQERTLLVIQKDIADLEADLQVNPVVSLKTQPEAAPVVEQVPVIEIEQYVPINEESVNHDKFTKDNAVDYETDFRTDDNGREREYISKISVPLNDEDGNSIGNLVKIIDEDKNISWNAEDENGYTIGKQDFDSKSEAQKALVDKANKIRKKEFDKEAKIKVKAAEKEAAKKAKAEQKKSKFAKDETVRPQPTGDRTGRTEGGTITPLKDSPTVQGVNGPDPQLVAVAEQYAKENGIPFKRQAEYVKVDEDRAIKIANAYEEMANDPQNPKVKEAYQNLIKQTIAQYEALVKAGYKFWFMDLNIPSNAEYASSPYNAIRDLRKNKEMGVFPTTDGYGANGLTELDVDNNPLLADTGIQWSVGSLDGPKKNVLANDLFRAVHDAFGHGLEGAGFRARGEENAWQAHVRLFNGSAIGALTSETRGQNSWLNYGPNGETNRTAKVEDTVFAEQKVGLMPEFTWTEGRSEDMKAEPTPKKTKAPVTEEGPTAEEVASIDALLDLDVDNDDNMLIVLNALDRADKSIGKTLKGGAFESLLAIPLSTVQVVIKALKVLVKGGMLLRDAIRKVAADNNLSQDTIKDILNIAPIQDGFNALMDKVGAIIERQTTRGIEEKKIVTNVDTFVRNSEVYQEANDAQKKILEREARTQAGARERRAPSIGRILGVLKDITNVSRKDKLKIISQIRQLSKDASKDLAKEIKDLATQGKITVNQAANIVSRFGKVNMLSEISVSKFVDYMTKVFADAEYVSKLNTAKSLKSSIASLSKNKEKNADLRELAKQFIEIDPSMVDDIDAYNDMASKIKEAVSGSSIKSQNISLARTVDIESSLDYISKTLDIQDKLMREVKAAEIQQLMGIDASEFSYDDMVDLLKKDKPITKYNEGIIRSTINKMFNIFSAMISENIKNGEDPITGEKIDYTKEQKRIINEFMNMDLSILEPKQSLEAVDALANFLQNKSTAKMGAMMAEYKGIMGTKTAVEENLKAQKLKKYGLEWLGQLLAENTTNLNILFERMFKGFNKGNRIQDLSGIKDVINNKAGAQKESSNKVEDYVKKFYNKLANGEAFNTAYNNVERGISSFMQRSIIGSESQKREFFNTRKKLIKQSIEVLSEGNDKEKEKAKLYQEAYDKLIAETKGPNENQILENESNSIEDVRRRTDNTNLDAIKYWQNSWSEKYDQLYNTALNIYNKVLGRDINYTPDRYSKLSSDTGIIELANDQSAFLNNNDVLYQKEAGVLIESKRPDNLPKNRYLDFAFDNNNANSYYEALVDMATAEPIRQVQGFLNSPLYKKVVPNADDAAILKDRIQLFINNFRNKNPYDNDQFSKFVRSLNVLADIGASMALGGITQPFKQVIPVAVNTLINAGSLDLSAPFNKAKNNFISNSGYGIANRGAESQAQVQSMNKLVEEAAKSSPEKIFNFIKKGNQFYLKQLLVNADAYIARASWMTYYEQFLKKQGIDTKGIDYTTEKINKDAADYAQNMVDRQQNVSDTDLSGKIFASKAPAVQVLVKTLMPFAGFRMNQASRLGSDIAVVTDKTATKEDKVIAIRSLMGYAAENVTFRLISAYFAYQLGSFGLKLLDREESEEEKEKRKNNLIKGQVTGTLTDVLSPVPIADKFVQSKVNDLVGAVQTGMNIPLENQYNIFGESKQDYVQNMGMFGIASERASQLFEISRLAATGKYTDDFGKEKAISEKDQKTLKPYIGLGFLSSIGLAPSETNTVLRYMIKAAKKKPSKTAEEQEEIIERKETKEENLEEKINALEKIKNKTRNKNVINAIDDKLNELEASPEEKKIIKEENKEEKEQKELLLNDPIKGRDYNTEADLKKYNRPLWEKNFGPRSEWYKEHKYEKEAESLMNKEIRKAKDIEEGYTSTKRGKRNKDGSIKRTYGRKS